MNLPDCDTMNATPEALSQLPKSLIAENGGAFGFVCIWRTDRPAGESSARYGISVGDWLSQPENQSGTWLIDGGWGGPPGPVHVRWDGDKWINGGYCGVKFAA